MTLFTSVVHDGKAIDAFSAYVRTKEHELLFNIAESDSFTGETRVSAINKLSRELGILPQ